MVAYNLFAIIFTFITEIIDFVMIFGCEYKRAAGYIK